MGPYNVIFQTLVAMMVAVGDEAPEVPSPAAAVLARRASRAALPESAFDPIYHGPH